MPIQLPRLLARALPALAAGALCIAAPAAAHDAAQHKAQAATRSGQESAVSVQLADVALVDHNGRATRLRSEAIGDRIAVVAFVYTRCTTICPVQSAMLASLQERLGERLDRTVRLLSISVDPVYDTPARLKEFAARYGSRPGWLWLTGQKDRVEDVLKAFGAYTPVADEHPPLVLVGEPRSGRWLSFYGFTDPARIEAAVARLSAATSAAAPAGGR